MIDYIRWIRTKPSCVACRTINHRKGRQPSCGSCVVDLSDEEYETVQIFLATRTHYILNVNKKIIDVNISAVESAMNIYNIQNKKECYERVRKLFYAILEEEQV